MTASRRADAQDDHASSSARASRRGRAARAGRATRRSSARRTASRTRRTPATTRRSRSSTVTATFPIYYPTKRTRGSLYAGAPRAYDIALPRRASATATGWCVKRGLVGEYYGMQGTTWKTPPILQGPGRAPQVRQARVRHLLRRRPRAAGRLAHATGRLLGHEHAAPEPLREADAGDSRAPRRVLGALNSPASCLQNASRSGSSARAGSALSRPPASPSWATTCTCATSSSRRSTRSRAARCRSTSRACPS